MTRQRLSTDARRVVGAQALRGFAYGFGSVLLGVTLDQRGFSSTEAGLVIAAVVTGTVLASLFVGRYADLDSVERAATKNAAYGSKTSVPGSP